jgi:hypothetical protein
MSEAKLDAILKAIKQVDYKVDSLANRVEALDKKVDKIAQLLLAPEEVEDLDATGSGTGRLPV